MALRIDESHECSIAPLHVLLAGDAEHYEFDPLRAWCRDHAMVVRDEANQRADLILICQTRPSQFSQAFVERLHALAPLASLLAILGSWCEGETRTGSPWHGVERVFWYEAVAHLNVRLAQRSLLAVVRTQTMAERIAGGGAWCSSQPRGTAVVVAHSISALQPLLDVCEQLGYIAHGQRLVDAWSHSPPQLVVWDADDATGSWLTALQERRSQWPAATFVALLNFPRRNEIEQLQSLGCQIVLGKPLLLGDLAASLSSCAASTIQPRHFALPQ